MERQTTGTNKRTSKEEKLLPRKRQKNDKKKSRSKSLHESSVGLKIERRKQIQNQELTENLAAQSRRKEQANLYLKTWRDDRNSWKYSKNIQTWLIGNAFDRKLIPKGLFLDFLVPYVQSMNGQVIDRLCDSCRKTIDAVEKDGATLDERVRALEKKANGNESVNRKIKLLRAQYKRANILLQVCHDANRKQ